MRSLGDARGARIIVYTDQPKRFPGREVVRIEARQAKHDLTSACFTDALRFGDPIVPIAADMIASDGLLDAAERAAADCDLLLCPVLRVEAETFIPELPVAGPINLAPRELCRLALKHWHPHQQLQRRERFPSRTQPTTIWERLGETVKARCFHMHPIMIRDRGPLPGGIDGAYVDRIPAERARLVTDSDELMVVDASRRDYLWEQRFAEPVDVVKWARRKTNRAHRRFFAQDCYLHAGDLEPFPDDGYYDAIIKELGTTA